MEDTVIYLNDAFQRTYGYEEQELVSVDYVGDKRSSIVDASSTLVVDQHHVKVLSWYDNEMGYSSRLLDLLGRIGR